MSFTSDATQKELDYGTRLQTAVPVDSCIIAGETFPRHAVEEAIMHIQGETPLVIESPPGFGKSYFALHGLKPILEEIYPVQYDIVYTSPFKIKNAADLFCRPSLVSNTMVWEDTWPIRKIKTAQQKGRAILMIVEEYSRMSSAAQNQFLDILDSGCFHIEQTGEEVHLPEYSKILLLGNPSGVGVSQIVEALSSRIISMEWPLPKADTMARMILNWAAKKIKPVTCAATSFGFNLVQRPLDFTVALAIAETAHSLSSVKKEPVSLREIKKCAEIWMHSRTDKLAVERIFKIVLAKGVEVSDDYQLKNRLLTAKSALFEKISR